MAAMARVGPVPIDPELPSFPIGSRIGYTFAVRDPLPLRGPATLLVHEPACHDDDSCGGAVVACPRAIVVTLLPEDHPPSSLLRDAKLVSQVIGQKPGWVRRQLRRIPRARRFERSIADQARSLEDWSQSQIAATVTSPWRGDDDTHTHYERSFDALHRVHKAIVLTTGAFVPALTIERCGPVYLVHQDGVLVSPIFVSHVIQKAGQIDDAQLEMVPRMMDALEDAAPVARIRDLIHSCDVALRFQGDYLGTLLRCATASEVLIKECAWMLLWESQNAGQSADPKETAVLFADKAEMTKFFEFLKRRLGGNWDSRQVTTAVGAWRTYVSEQRTRCLHFGVEPTAISADEALDAVHRLAGFLSDRLAENVTKYPSSAVMLLGSYGLEMRNTALPVSFDEAEHPRLFKEWKVANLSKFDGTYGRGFGPSN